MRSRSGAAPRVQILYIEPGSMWEIAYTGTLVERFADEPLER